MSGGIPKSPWKPEFEDINRYAVYNVNKMEYSFNPTFVDKWKEMDRRGIAIAFESKAEAAAYKLWRDPPGRPDWEQSWGIEAELLRMYGQPIPKPKPKSKIVAVQMNNEQRYQEKLRLEAEEKKRKEEMDDLRAIQESAMASLQQQMEKDMLEIFTRDLKIADLVNKQYGKE